MVSQSQSAVPRGPDRPRVLVLAEAANPEWVSVPLVGWSLARALARRVNAHLVTQVRNRDAILRAGLVEGVDFTCIDSEVVARPLNRIGAWIAGLKGRSFSTITALETLAYYEFERRAWKRFGSEIKRGEWDVVHRVTPLSPVMASPMAARCARVGVPFVIGPLNGGVPWPKGFEALAREDREWLTRVRSVHKYLPGHRSTRARAAAILVGSRTAHSEISGRWRSKCFYMPENGVEAEAVATKVNKGPARPLRAIFLGRLVPLKGVDLLIEAAAPLAREGRIEVEIVGEGRQRQVLEELVRREKVEAQIKFAGWVDHAHVAEHLSRAHALVLPSVREFGGGVVVESMAQGTVPIVLDHGGPPELVSPATGIVVRLGTRDEIIAGLRSALLSLYEDRERLAELSARCLERARTHFTWDAKAARLAELYDWILAPSGRRPVFPMPIGDDLHTAAHTPAVTPHQRVPPLR
ncbi:MAG: glycosyltransferase family 4 protein [Planctomycetes bacterium]|nr:glycosyltransferase family 4 protein [Planctomycetota bacterium]